MKTTTRLLGLCLALATTPVLADDDCDAPVQRWQSRDAVRQMAAAKGWQVQRLKIDDGCYEIRGTDADGRAFKATIDPETLQVMKMKRRDRERERDRERNGEQAAPARAEGAPTTAPLFAPGGAPRGQIE